MAKRREPVTPEMIEYAQERRKHLPISSPEHALLDLNVLGRHCRFRLSKWALNEENKKNFPLQEVDRALLALTFQYFAFTGKNNKTLKQNFT